MLEAVNLTGQGRRVRPFAIDRSQGRGRNAISIAVVATVLTTVAERVACQTADAAAWGSGSPSGPASVASGVIDLPRLTAPIEFDGKTNDAAWHAVPPLPLTMHSPTYQGTPSERTVLRVAYDDEYIWVGGSLYERDPKRIDAYSLERDRWAGDDTFGIILDTFNDNENAVRFVATPYGVRLDYNIADDGDDVSDSWDTFWDVRTVISDEGWTRGDAHPTLIPPLRNP